jgi:oligopeptide transport system ATP-binding protein
MADPMLEAEGLTTTFRVGRGLLRSPLHVRAVDDVSLALRAGETLAIVGESGCGKSTLGRLLMRLIEPTAGVVRFEGEDITALGGHALRRKRRHLQMIFQDPFASLDPRMTVGATLAEPLALHGVGSRADRRTRIAELLGLVGLPPSYAARYPHEFSGGQRQRIGIARALAVRPKVIVGDEPVSALDVSIQAQIINLLQDLQEKLSLSLIVIAHDLAVVKHMSDRVAVMYLGRIVERADARTLFAEPRHPYTRALLSAAPVADPSPREAPQILEGDVPSPSNPPPGCHLHSRCPFARERCRAERPALETTDGGHAVACHFWRELPAPASLLAQHARLATPPYQARLDVLARAVARRERVTA